MKCRYFYILILFLFYFNVSAQNSWFFKYGFNFSKFRDVSSYYIQGNNFYIAREWDIHNNLFLTFGFHYNTQGGKLNDVLVAYKKINLE